MPKLFSFGHASWQAEQGSPYFRARAGMACAGSGTATQSVSTTTPARLNAKADNLSLLQHVMLRPSDGGICFNRQSEALSRRTMSPYDIYVAHISGTHVRCRYQARLASCSFDVSLRTVKKPGSTSCRRFVESPTFGSHPQWPVTLRPRHKNCQVVVKYLSFFCLLTRNAIWICREE